MYILKILIIKSYNNIIATSIIRDNRKLRHVEANRSHLMLMGGISTSCKKIVYKLLHVFVSQVHIGTNNNDYFDI